MPSKKSMLITVAIVVAVIFAVNKVPKLKALLGGNAA